MLWLPEIIVSVEFLMATGSIVSGYFQAEIFLKKSGGSWVDWRAAALSSGQEPCCVISSHNKGCLILSLDTAIPAIVG